MPLLTAISPQSQKTRCYGQLKNVIGNIFTKSISYKLLITSTFFNGKSQNIVFDNPAAVL